MCLNIFISGSSFVATDHKDQLACTYFPARSGIYWNHAAGQILSANR